VFAHPPTAMLTVLADHGLTPRREQGGGNDNDAVPGRPGDELPEQVSYPARH
jgi:hypothetical protein